MTSLTSLQSGVVVHDYFSDGTFLLSPRARCCHIWLRTCFLLESSFLLALSSRSVAEISISSIFLSVTNRDKTRYVHCGNLKILPALRNSVVSILVFSVLLRSRPRGSVFNHDLLRDRRLSARWPSPRVPPSEISPQWSPGMNWGFSWRTFAGTRDASNGFKWFGKIRGIYNCGDS